MTGFPIIAATSLTKDEINHIIGLYEKSSSPANKALLNKHLMKLKKSAKLCKDESLLIQNKFDWWATFTTSLARAIVAQRSTPSYDSSETGSLR